VADTTSEALPGPAGLAPGRATSGRVALCLLAAGAIGTLAWCGLIAYGTIRLVIG
jgi:hypothetical protein